MSAWLEKLEALDPFHIELGLDRARVVLGRMNLVIKARVVMVGGTNGKGSTVAILERLLSLQGLESGVYTSPHILHFRERIRIAGNLATDNELVSAFNTVEKARQGVALTYFEFTTLAAFWLFSQVDLDFWLLEVGLGGRLDAVNLINADVSIVTNIGLDHQAWLGDTLEEIAAEKAAIYRSGMPAVYGSLNRPSAIDQSIDAIQAKGVLAGKDFGIDENGSLWQKGVEEKIRLPAESNVVSENFATAIAALGALNLVSSQADVDKLNSFALPGRHQHFNFEGTKIIADVAHNADSVELLANRVATLVDKELIAVVGVMRDKVTKDLIVPMLHWVDEWILVKPESDRAASIAELEGLLAEVGVSNDRVQACPNIQLLPDMICGREAAVIYGSFYTIGECFSVMEVEVG